MLWQGTAPIVLNASFYLVTIHKTSNIQKKLQVLASLATLYTSEDSKHGMNARIHGGYKYMYYNTQTNNLINNAGIAKSKIPKILELLYHFNIEKRKKKGRHPFGCPRIVMRFRR